MAIWISDRVRAKLAEKHGGITDDEILQCFQNLEPGSKYLLDTREENQSNPPTVWFISETNRRRKLKIVFITRRVDTSEGYKLRLDIKLHIRPMLSK